MKSVSRRTLLRYGLASAACACPAWGVTQDAQPELPFEPRHLSTGAGAFLAAGGRGRESARIRVHYYKPRRWTAQSRFLFVIPGAGRNSDTYRDAWIEVAESANLLIASLGYPEAQYDFAAYHLGGVVRDLSFPAEAANADVVNLRDEDISFTPNPQPNTWLFNDFDRIFSLLVAATGSSQTAYDLFGHSAGAQILHRLVLFRPRSCARHIVAANAGFYTLPDLDTPLLFGLRGSGINAASLARSFACLLTLLLGEKDNSDAAGGIQLHTPLADRQGLDRLSRGQFFFRFGQERAQAMKVPFAWRLQTVPNVGHDFRAMSRAAAQLLYGQPSVANMRFIKTAS